MRRLALLLILACACASSTSDSSPVVVRLADAHLSGDIRYAGPMAAQFVVEVTNPTNETVTLRHVEIRTVATGNFTVRASASFDRERSSASVSPPNPTVPAGLGSIPVLHSYRP